MPFSLLLIVGVFFISLILTMVGLGGGLIFSPLFVLLGMVKEQAAAASLFLNLTAAGSAAYAYSRKGMVDFSLSIPLIVSSAAAAPFGAYLNTLIDTGPFLMIMAAILALAGLRMLLSQDRHRPAKELSKRKKMLGGMGIGAAIGAMAGLLGIGGGVFVVPLLIFLLKTPTKTAAASSTFIVCFSSLTGFVGYASMGSVNWGFILPAAAVSLMGGLTGARIMSDRLQGRSIRILFSIILFGLCAKLLHEALLGP
jgi:uncharacterized protein